MGITCTHSDRHSYNNAYTNTTLAGLVTYRAGMNANWSSIVAHYETKEYAPHTHTHTGISPSILCLLMLPSSGPRV